MSLYTKEWDSKTVPDGTHNIYAVITDTAGNAFTTPTVIFTVKNVTKKPKGPRFLRGS